MMNLGERIRIARAVRGVHQKDVAAALGKSRATISMWESGTNEPSLQQIDDLSSYLGVSSVWMTHGEGQPPALSTPITQGDTL